MPRRPRVCPGGPCFRVLNLAVARLPLFEKPEDYEAFERALIETHAQFPLPIFCYCLMTNLWHFIVHLRMILNFSEFFRWLPHTHVMHWHAHHQTEGTEPLYQWRFKAFPIEPHRRGRPSCAVLCYVERNPVRANLGPTRGQCICLHSPRTGEANPGHRSRHLASQNHTPRSPISETPCFRVPSVSFRGQAFLPVLTQYMCPRVGPRLYRGPSLAYCASRRGQHGDTAGTLLDLSDLSLFVFPFLVSPQLSYAKYKWPQQTPTLGQEKGTQHITLTTREDADILLRCLVARVYALVGLASMCSIEPWPDCRCLKNQRTMRRLIGYSSKLIPCFFCRFIIAA
jgi:hypothetical protein